MARVRLFKTNDASPLRVTPPTRCATVPGVLKVQVPPPIESVPLSTDLSTQLGWTPPNWSKQDPTIPVRLTITTRLETSRPTRPDSR
jgi:hypothetical protein